MIETEATHFVRQYLDGRSLVQKVFDPHGNDIGTYQARELSYLFDAVDARVLEVLLARSVPFFVPLSALLASFLTTIVFFVGSGKVAPQLRPVMAALILLLYLSNHVYVVTTAVYYRSTKCLAYRRVMLASKWLPGVHAQSALLKQSFEQQRPANDLTPDYRALYDFFRARPAGAAAR